MDHSEIAAAVFDKRAKLYEDKFMDVRAYHHSFDVFCAALPTPAASVLEIGCGPGNITRYLLSKHPALKILGIDLAPAMIQLAIVNNPKATFDVMDARKIASLHQQFDAVMCGFCLPYLSKEESVQLIADAAHLLVTGGIIYLSTMEDEESRSGPQTSSAGDSLYMYYHQASYLLAALIANNFKIVEQLRQDYPAAETKTTDLIIVAEKC